VPALKELIDNGTVCLIDLIFVTKVANGEVTWVKIDALGELTALAAEDHADNLLL
jgi:hypothetical protein